MKIKTLKAIRNLLRSRNLSLPVLDYFLIDSEYLSYTNLETHIRVKHQFPFKPDSEPIVVRADHFIQRIERIKAPYFITGDANLKITFEQSESESTMAGLQPAIEYPMQPTFKGAKKICTITAYELNIMNTAIQFTAEDELRPVMQTVCLDIEHIVASDAHKLYYKKIKKITDTQVLFERAVVKLLLLAEGQSFAITQYGNYYCADSPEMTVYWRSDHSISSSYNNYPAWQKVVPEPKFRAIIPVKETINALSAIMFAANPASGRIIFNITSNRMKLSCSDLDYGLSASETVNIINSDSNDIEFGLKGQFILQVLKSLQNEGFAQVTMGWSEPNKSILFQDQILIMPMMLNTD